MNIAINYPKKVGLDFLLVPIMAVYLLLNTPTALAEKAHGPLIWSDEFNSFQDSVWTHEVGNGCDRGNCNWGNAEREYYAAENTSIEKTPNDPDPTNKSLVIEAREEFRGGMEYTSARIISQNKISVHYGMVEVRMMAPDLNHGLWPAAWLLGDSVSTWPKQGEIDMVEMGHAAEERHFGHCDLSVNQFTASNIFWYSDGACSPGNATCAAMYAWRPTYEAPSNVSPYCSPQPLNNRFVRYRMYWTPTAIDMSVVDEASGIEHPMMKTFFINGGDSNLDTFSKPFYLLLNMAVGGNVPRLPVWDATRRVTAPLPGKMYVDYVRVYQYEGNGEVIVGDGKMPITQPLAGSVGVFTDRTGLDNYVLPGSGSNVFVWEKTLLPGPVVPAPEGTNVITWSTDPTKGWFGAGVAQNSPQNLSNYAGGTLNFRVKAPADFSFRVGVTSNGGENWIDFPANETKYGLVRNGQWGTVSIPIHTLRGFSAFGDKLNLASVTNMFAILSKDGAFPATSVNFALDDIYWTQTGGTNVTDSDGDRVIDLEDQCAGTQAGARVGDNGCAIVPETGLFGVFSENPATTHALNGTNSDVWVWEKTLKAGPVQTPAEGAAVLSWSGAANNWFGAGVQARNPIDFSNHLAGALKFKIKIPANVSFQIGVLDKAGKENWVSFPANQTVYGLNRAAAAVAYQEAVIPLHYLAGPSANGYKINITSITYPFAILNDKMNLPAAAFDVAIDDIVWDTTGGVSIYDGDHDRVIDIDDQCPGTPEATRVSNTGCPIVAHVGTFGVATETRTVNAKLDGNNSSTWVWENTFSACSGAPFEGSASICWQGKPNSWFGAGIEAKDPLDLSNFANGNLHFKIKVPNDLEFRIGIFDTSGHENWLRFPANTPKYGLTRNTSGWQDAVIPVSELRGRLVDLKSLTYAFTVLSVNGAFYPTTFNMEIDDIYYDGGVVIDGDVDGVNDANDRCPTTTPGARVNGVGCSDADLRNTSSLSSIKSSSPVASSNSSSSTIQNPPLSSAKSSTPVASSSSRMSSSLPVASSRNSSSSTTPGDLDNDGVLDGADRCANTPANTAVDRFGCTVHYAMGARQTNSTSAEFYVDSHDWADVHFTVNGGTQQSVRMTMLAAGNSFTVNGLKGGDKLVYEFVYWDRVCNCQTESKMLSLTIAGSASSTPRSSTPSSLNSSSKPNIASSSSSSRMPGDFDGDGILDGADRCANTPANTAVDRFGCTLNYTMGVRQLNSTSAEFYVNSPDWADVHYQVNNGAQQSVRMTMSVTGNTFRVGGLKAGDILSYDFVYMDRICNCQTESQRRTQTIAN